MANQPAGDHFGGRLKAARERRGVSLRQIANATKISVGVLEALERNNFSRLPGGIFSRAFIRSYAVEVGLDPEQTIEEFLEQLPPEAVTAVHHAADPIEDHDAIQSDREAASTFVRLVAISVPIAAFLIYLGVRGLRPPQTAQEPLPAAAAVPADVPAPAPVTAAAPAEAAPAVVSTLPATAAVTATVPGAAAAAVPAVAQPSDDHPVPVASAADADRLTVAISSSRPCWLSLTVDGQRTPGRMLQPGEQQTIEVQRDIVLTAGDAAALSITLNGADARPLGRDGEVVTTRLTPSNFKQFLAGR